MASNFIRRKLNEVKCAIDNNCLKCVRIVSGVDTSFGKGYIRWYVYVELTDGMIYNSLENNYESYRIWCKDDSFRNNDIDAEEMNNTFNSTILEYKRDVTRFCELLMTHYPNIRMFNQLSNFGMLGRNLFMISDYNVSLCIKNDVKFDFVSFKRLNESEINAMVDIDDWNKKRLIRHINDDAVEYAKFDKYREATSDDSHSRKYMFLSY